MHEHGGACRVDYGHAEAAHVYGADPRKYEVSTRRFLKNPDGTLKVPPLAPCTVLATRAAVSCMTA